MRKLFLRTAAILAAVLLSSGNVLAISAGSAVLMDGTTGQILYQHNPDSRSLIASTTKIMTALVVCEQCNVLDRVKIPPEAVGVEGSSLYLQEGEILTVQELLYGLMLHSGNDAAVALAIYCGGTVEGFAEMMNDKARLLGLEGTHFVNPHGLDAPDHYSCARDLAVLAAYAMENPIFYRSVSAKSVRIGSRQLTNHNKLLWQVEGADGVKTGYTRAAGRILVGSATRDGRRLICVTINDPDDWRDHKTLLEQGFREYTPRQVIASGQVLGQVEILGTGSYAQLIADEDFTCALRSDEEVTLEYSGQSFVYGPVSPGEEAGWAYVLLGDTVLGKIPLVYGETVAQMPEQSFWDKLLGGVS